MGNGLHTLMTFDQIAALVVLVGVVGVLIHGKLRADVVALTGAAVLLLLGVVRPVEVQGAFASPAVIALAGLFVIAYAIELSGLLGAIYVVQNFDHVFTITSGGLGTANLPYYIYQTFYTAQDYGRASAAGVVVVIGTIIIATFALRSVFSLFKEESR